MQIPREMQELMEEMEQLLDVNNDNTCDYDYVALRNKAHRYMETLTREQREYFEEESSIELLEILSDDIEDRYNSSGKKLSRQERAMPIEMRALFREIEKNHSDDGWLALEEKVRAYLKRASAEEKEMFLDYGPGEMLSMICEGIRYRRDPHYYDKMEDCETYEADEYGEEDA